jgi:HK97 family phage portal protein
MNWLDRMKRTLVRVIVRQAHDVLARSMADQHPEFSSIEHLMRDLLQQDPSAQTFYNYRTAAQDLNTHPWVHKAIHIWSDSISPLPIRIRRADGQLDHQHELIRLLEHPNPDMTPTDLWREWTTNMAIGGECGFEFVKSARGRLVEIHPRNPIEFAVVPDLPLLKYRKVLKYIVDPENKTEKYMVPPDEFKHFKFFNPLNVWRGIGPLTAVRMGVVLDELIQTWSLAFFRNAAQPSYAIIVPQGLTPDERAEMERVAASKWSGPDGWHKPIILENGVQDIKIISHPRKDVEWLQQRQVGREEVGSVFGIPDEIMGFGKDTFRNFETAERVLWSVTLTNLIRYRDDQLTHFFHEYGQLDMAERIVTDLSGVWVLRRTKAIEFDDALKLFEMGVPFNVLDEKLQLGIGKVKGGDEPHAGWLRPAIGNLPTMPSVKAGVEASETQNVASLLERMADHRAALADHNNGY